MKIADLIDPNWWAEHIGEKSGIFEKARNSKIRAWTWIRGMEMVGMANYCWWWNVMDI